MSQTETSVASTLKPQAPATDAAGSKTQLPIQPITSEVLLEKYAKGSEATSEDVNRRVANALGSA